MTAPDPEPPVKLTAWIPLSHEMLVDLTDHVCGDSCPPPCVPPPLSRRQRQRLRLRARRVWWTLRRVGGLRLVHKDRIDQDERRDDDW